MIEIALFSAAGFLVAALIALLALPYLTGQAARSAVHKVRANMPFSAAEMAAEKDQLRAEHAVALRKLEMTIEKQTEKISTQKIELDETREKISAANKISKAGKLALEEIRSKEIDLNDRLRQRDAEYAGLEQRSRRMLRENRDLKLALRKEGKIANNVSALKDDNAIEASAQNDIKPENQAELQAALEKERQNNTFAKEQINELQEKLLVALNTANDSHTTDKKSMRLPKAPLPSILDGKNDVPKNVTDKDTIAELQEQLLNMAAQMAHITATVEGDHSNIKAILETANETTPQALSSRMKMLIAQASKEMPKQAELKTVQKTAQKETKKPLPKKASLPKAKGLSTTNRTRKAASTEKA